MTEAFGVAIAIVSSSLGGSAAAVTRYLVGAADPITLAILRWVIGFAIVLPVALWPSVRWPQGRDRLAVAALGVCFFGLFFILYNIALGFTTAATLAAVLVGEPITPSLVVGLLAVFSGIRISTTEAKPALP